jgi:hypothetical protein
MLTGSSKSSNVPCLLLLLLNLVLHFLGNQLIKNLDGILNLKGTPFIYYENAIHSYISIWLL